MSKVLIIGGGLIGLSIARELSEKGHRQILVIDRGEIGKEASFAAGGMLAVQAETVNFGSFYKICCESLGLYQGFADGLLAETGISIELDKAGTLYLAFNEKDLDEIRERYRWQTKAGLDVEKLNAREITKMEPFVSPDVLEGLYFPSDWQVDNRRILAALQKYCALYAIETIENTEIKSIQRNHDRTFLIEAETQKFVADIVILATGAWTSLIKSDGLRLPPIKPIRGQIVQYRTAKRLFSRVIYSPRGYLVPRFDGRILAGTTSEDVGFDKSTTKIGMARIKEYIGEIAPSVKNLAVSDHWAGLRPQSPDDLPVFGQLAENLYVASAHYRNGVLLAPITAQIIAEKIINNYDSEYFTIFDPKRFG